MRGGQAEAALEPLTTALGLDDRVRYGAAHLAMGDALVALRRPAEAVDAYRRYLEIHTSSLEGYYKLARASSAPATRPARAAHDEALGTYRVLPRFQRRKQLWWWLAVHVA